MKKKLELQGLQDEGISEGGISGLEKVKRALPCADVNTAFEGRYPLLYAAEKGDFAIVEHFLNIQNVNVNIHLVTNVTPVWEILIAHNKNNLWKPIFDKLRALGASFEVEYPKTPTRTSSSSYDTSTTDENSPPVDDEFSTLLSSDTLPSEAALTAALEDTKKLGPQLRSQRVKQLCNYICDKNVTLSQDAVQAFLEEALRQKHSIIVNRLCREKGAILDAKTIVLSKLPEPEAEPSDELSQVAVIIHTPLEEKIAVMVTPVDEPTPTASSSNLQAQQRQLEALVGVLLTKKSEKQKQDVYSYLQSKISGHLFTSPKELENAAQNVIMLALQRTRNRFSWFSTSATGLAIKKLLKTEEYKDLKELLVPHRNPDKKSKVTDAIRYQDLRYFVSGANLPKKFSCREKDKIYGLFKALPHGEDFVSEKEIKTTLQPDTK